MKLGINLSEQRIAIFNNVEEINFNEIPKLGDVILKVSNGYGDNTFIFENKKEDIKTIKKKVMKTFSRDFGFAVP
jgi:hypothetical protein